MICFILLVYLLFPSQVLGNDFWALGAFHKSNADSLLERKVNWPEWKSPGPLRRPGMKEDLIYPKWFEGNWNVQTIDINDSNKESFDFIACFYKDRNQNTIGARAFNAKSLGSKIFGDKLIDIKDDPDSPNRSVALFLGGDSLETKIIGRTTSEIDEEKFISDELAMQIFHASQGATSRISQVETLSFYRQCNVQQKLNHFDICGEQWQARYQSDIGTLKSIPLNTNHYYVFLRRIQ